MNKKPLVLCLTNTVAANFTANCLLVIGARAAMIEEPCEAEALARVADAMLVNLGTVTARQAESMRRAIAAANAHGIPWALDPVGVQLLSYRADLVREFIAQRPSVIRCNAAELAKAVRADGVHVGQGDVPPDEVRAIVGPRCEIGLSITDIRQIQSGETPLPHSVDCIGIGPVFDARKTKADASEAMGPEGLRAIVDAAPDLPNCAIGGITLANAAEVIAAGAKGLAVVSAFSKSEDPYGVAKAFRMLFDDCRK